MEMNIKLVKAKRSDREFLITLRKRTMVKHLEKAGLFLSHKQHVARVDDRYQDAYLINLDGKSIGVIKYHIDEKEVNIMQVQIAPIHQKRGYGGAVVQHVIDKFSPMPICLRVLKDNPAFKLYKRLGFKLVDEDKYEYHMRWQNAVG